MRCSLAGGLLGVWLMASVGFAQEVTIAPVVAERPWCIFACRGLERLLTRVDALLTAVDRPELSDVLAQRYDGLKDFQGLDRKRPLGLMWAWTEADPSGAEVLFLPVTDREPLLNLITQGVVPYRKVADDRYIIERPEVPYHALVRRDYLWCGDVPATLLLFASRSDALLRELPPGDLSLSYDLRQVPPAVRRRWAEAWRATLEPRLQQRDGESKDVYGWRRTVGQALVEAAALAWEQTSRLSMGLTLNPEESEATLEVVLLAQPDSNFARLLDRWRGSRSPLLHLDQPTAISAGFVTLRQLTPVPAAAPATADDDWELAWQVFGSPQSVRNAVIVIRQPQLAALSDAAKANVEQRVERQSVSFRRVLTPNLPSWLRAFVGWDPEIWLGRSDQAVWLGFGPPKPAEEALSAALRTVNAATPAPPPTLLRARFVLRDLLPYLGNYLDPVWAHEQLQVGDDQIQLVVVPVPNGLKLTVTFDAGILRLVGSALAGDLATELEGLVR